MWIYQNYGLENMKNFIKSSGNKEKGAKAKREVVGVLSYLKSGVLMVNLLVFF